MLTLYIYPYMSHRQDPGVHLDLYKSNDKRIIVGRSAESRESWRERLG